MNLSLRLMGILVFQMMVMLPFLRAEEQSIVSKHHREWKEYYVQEDASLLLDRPVVINLERHHQRFDETALRMQQAGFKDINRFNAVDGFFTDQSFFDHLNIHGGGPGQKGCAASHLLVWKAFAEEVSDRKYLFVCEDDMLPHSDFATLFPLYWSQTPANFDIVLVGNQSDFTSDDELVIPRPAFCLHAYIITKKGAKRLLELYQKLDPTDGDLHVIDIFMAQAMVHKQVRFYCYNGLKYPDEKNQDLIFKSRDTGICFQNKGLGSSIHGVNIVHE